MPLFFFSLLLLVPFARPQHALYLSLTEVRVAGSAGSLEVKVFSDDLQDALRNYSDSYQPGSLENYFERNEQLATDYFAENLTIRVNGQKADLQYQGFSRENDAHFIRFRMKLPAETRQIAIEAGFLMEVFPDQVNVVKVLKGQQARYLRFNRPAALQTLSFDY